MATDAQLSGPLPGEKFTVSRWVQIFGAESGIVGDTNGSAFGITLPPASDVAEIGSPSIESIAIVGGFPLIIPAGLTQSLEIPPSTNASIGRTDLIVARLDTAAFTTAPGPVRLQRFAGTEGSSALPTYDATSPSPDTLPLWAVTRKMGESLNQATVQDMRIRTAPSTLSTAEGTLPQSPPLGTRATRDGITWHREMVGSSAQWVQESWPTVVLTGNAATKSTVAGWQRSASCRMTRIGKMRSLHLVVTRNPGADEIRSDERGSVGGPKGLAVLHDVDRPADGVPMAARILTIADNPFMGIGVAGSTGTVSLIGTAPDISIAWSSVQNKGAEIALDATWWVS